MTFLSENQKDDFRVGLAIWNGARGTEPRSELIILGDDICAKIVETHDTFADFVKAHGQPSFSRTTPFGYQIHVWRNVQFRNVQFRKGTPRGKLYLMEFEGVSASMYAGV